MSFRTGEFMLFEHECSCGNKWFSEELSENCPMCGEYVFGKRFDEEDGDY